ASDFWLSIVHPDDQARVAADAAAISAGGAARRLRFRWVAGNGEPVWVDAHVSPIVDAGEEPVGARDVAVDDSDRRQVATGLRESRRLVEKIVAAIPAVLFVFDVETRSLLYCNRETETVTGRTPDDLQRLGDAVIPTLLHPDEGARRSALRSMLAAANGEVQSVELRVRDAGGEWRWFTVRVAALSRDASGAPRQVVGAALDITARVRADDELREARQRFALAAAAGRVGVWDIDLVGGTSYFDPTAAAMFGLVMDEYRGRADWIARIHPDDLERVLDHERAMLDPAAPRDADGNTPGTEIEYRVRDRYGATRWIADRATLLRGTDGTPTRLVGATIDISERKRADEALRALTGSLLRAQDDERRRIARELHDGVAQELAAIAINLLRVDRLTPELPAKARGVLEETEDLVATTLREVRAFAHLLHPPLIDRVGLAGALRWYARGFSTRSGIAVDISGVTDVGRLSRDVAAALYRVAQESLGNIQRHSGSTCATIRLRWQPGGLMLEVRDRGQGLAASADGAEATAGVGIAGMRERLRLLGGRLEVRSLEPGVMVRATLPARIARAEVDER
ncbi:MAG: PAS domain-containing protein, partial [Thermomicrobiales bacterium]|nr:PAS domain-containing protein [Thermomicrobiales bacterium]